MSTIRFKAFSESFSSYWSEIATIFFQFFSCQNNEISIHILCPQSGLKHSVVHSQVIGIKFQRFFSFFFRVKMMKFLSIYYVHNQV